MTLDRALRPGPAWVRVVAPIVVGVLILALWMLVVDVLRIAPRALPSPVAVVNEIVLHADIIGEDMAITATNALIGLAVGAIVAIVLAGLAAASRPIDGMLAPLVAAIAVVPIVAITPILNTMYGASSQFGRQSVAAIAAFVPIFINVLRGLRQTDPVHRDLMRASAATGLQTFRALTLPTALPYLLTGLRIASSVAVIAALVAEYFGGPADGIGTAIATYAKSGRAALAFAYVAGGIAIGLALFLVTSLIERLVTRRTPV
ncbi:ABC transporter permease subunit [Leifsonia sp. H3M29-4]|uniref:ABC transporter permease n=1 Tax=Salinibacterium metalliresistens TaxID=3031321 RepID=UPI0023DB4883|nr:ABC transporter permease subunit [Salinibacterium metalliresistens]MDF1479618.1 ABC transporter permease subunit [Salinibacterium metalliresistens]